MEKWSVLQWPLRCWWWEMLQEGPGLVYPTGNPYQGFYRALWKMNALLEKSLSRQDFLSGRQLRKMGARCKMWIQAGPFLSLETSNKIRFYLVTFKFFMFSVPTLASDGRLSYWVLLSEQIPLSVWNNLFQTELPSYLLRASPVSLVPTSTKRNCAVVLPSLVSSADSQGKAILGQMLSYIWGREWSSEQKQYRTGYTVFQGWLLVPVSKSLVSHRSHKISDPIPWRSNPR